MCRSRRTKRRWDCRFVNRAPINSSLKSITASARNGSETLSTTTFLAVVFQHQIVGAGIVELDLVLEPRAAAALERDAQPPLGSPEASLISASRAKARGVDLGGERSG